MKHPERSEKVTRSELSRVFTDHRARVGRVLRRAGVPERDVPDAQQDVFIVVQRKLAEFEGRSGIASWLHGIAVRVASQYRRSARARYERMTEGERSDPLQAAVAHERCAVRALDDAALRTKLEAALLALSAPQREVFALHELHELSMHEVAAQLDVPLKTAFSRLYAARRALAESLRAAGVQLADSQNAELPMAARTSIGTWIGFMLAWGWLRAARVVRAQISAMPKLAVAAMSVACALMVQPADGTTRLQLDLVQRSQARELRFDAVRIDTLAPATASEGVTATRARGKRRTAPVAAAAAAAEVARPDFDPGPAPAIDYEVYRAGALDLRPSFDNPLTPQASSTRLAPRIRLRGPSDPIMGVELAFASD